MLQNYICYNGEYVPGGEKHITHHNRAFCFGDALFESIHCLGTQPQFLDNHWLRLSQGMKILKMFPDKDFTRELIKLSIEKLLNKNRIFKGARIRLAVFRDEGGLYTPEHSTISWIMEAMPLEHEKFELNQKGLVIDIFDEIHKPVNILANLKTGNALLFVLAGIYRKENRLDDCIILNQFGRITECISSNIYLVTGNTIITPPLSEGCIAGTMRSNILKIAILAGYKTEERGILEKYLLDAEEIFITNAIRGIQWVGAYKEKRYFNFAARKLIISLNELGFPPN
jgi:branched-subunit amino acid aminotransferase/4-amino-4-deoxychorismate lyase